MFFSITSSSVMSKYLVSWPSVAYDMKRKMLGAMTSDCDDQTGFNHHSIIGIIAPYSMSHNR